MKRWSLPEGRNNIRRMIAELFQRMVAELFQRMVPKLYSSYTYTINLVDNLNHSSSIILIIHLQKILSSIAELKNGVFKSITGHNNFHTINLIIHNK
jgi:hypothetical protein